MIIFEVHILDSNQVDCDARKSKHSPSDSGRGNFCSACSSTLKYRMEGFGKGSDLLGREGGDLIKHSHFRLGD